MERTRCPDCSSSDGLADYEDGTYCHSCHKKQRNLSLIKKPTEDKKGADFPLFPWDMLIDPDELGWLANFGLGKEVHKFQVFHDEKSSRLCFPYFSDGRYLGCWMRSLIEKPKWLYAGEKNFCWIYYQNQDILSNRVAVVEDVISALRVSKFCDVICLGGTSFKNEYVEEEIKKYKNLIAFFDGDTAGKKAAELFRNHHKLIKNVKVIRNRKDPKEYNDPELERLLNG